MPVATDTVEVLRVIFPACNTVLLTCILVLLLNIARDRRGDDK